MKLHADLREFIGLLTSHGVEFVVVGGHAVAYHGYPRFTGDLDFLVRPTHANARRLLEVLRVFGLALDALSEDDFTREGRVVQLGYPPNRIDLLTSISGVSFDDVWSDRVEAALDGLPVPMMGLQTLLTNKRATGRLRDAADADEIERRARPRRK